MMDSVMDNKYEKDQLENIRQHIIVRLEEIKEVKSEQKYCSPYEEKKTPKKDSEDASEVIFIED